FKTVCGEIDIVAEKKQILYFIEVKTRSNLNKGKPYEAVNKRKIDHMYKAANYFLLKYPHKNYRLRLAVISILLGAKKEVEFYDDIS
ncbi:YraN family protein, partial [Patescibacteria group bacterium]|nr:YraN family protein [Patescibacteria group bacterium]